MEILEARTLMAGSLLKDLNAYDQTIPSMVGAGTSLYFTVRNATRGTDLYKTDGTDAGTLKMRSFEAIPGGLDDLPVDNLTAVGSTLYFTAYDPATGVELWKTEGTSATTVPVIDLTAGSASSKPTKLTAVGSTLYFTIMNSVNTQELWLTLGTVASTSRVNLPVGTKNPNSLTAVGPTLYFSAVPPTVNGQPNYGGLQQLWKTDTLGTIPLQDPTSAFPAGLTAMGSTLYFASGNAAFGDEVWKSNGTPGTTIRVTDINPGPATSFPTNLTAVGSILYFVADDGVHGRELWKTDGTTTSLVYDLNPTSNSFPSDLSPLPSTNLLIFTANIGVQGRVLWKTDGTTTAPLIVGGSPIANATMLTRVGSTVFFVRPTAGGPELWKTDGTSTVLVKDLSADAQGADVGLMAGTADAAYFTFTTAPEGFGRLLRSDGNATGTTVFRRFTPTTTRDSLPQGAMTLGNDLLFFANDGVNDGLWRSDGSPTGTTRVQDFQSAASATTISPVAYNGSAYYLIRQRSTATGLWRYDPASGSSVKVAAITDLEVSDSMVVFDGALYFTKKGYSSPTELWSSNGSAVGTRLFQSFGTSFDASVKFLTVAGSRLFFAANDGSGSKLWKLEAGAAAATPVTELGGATPVINPSGLTAVASTLFFTAGPGNAPTLWKVDPGTGQAVPVVDGASAPVPISGAPKLTAVGSTLFFVGGPTSNLWTVGLTGPAAVVKDADGIDLVNPGPLTALGSTVFFAADRAVGRELWASDGSANSAYLVKDIHPGLNGSNPTDMTAIGSTLFFTANDGVRGAELWMSDGSPGGTKLAADIRAGSASAFNNSTGNVLGKVGNRLVVAAHDGFHGVEPIYLNLNTASNTAPTLAPIAPVAGTVGEQLTFLVQGSDADIGQSLTYSLEAPTLGASIDPVTGVVSWTPSQVGNYTLAVRVTDNAAPNLSSPPTVVPIKVTGAPPALVSTTTTLGVSATTITVGQSVTLTANVTAANGATPTGSVTFFDNGVTLETVPLVGSSASLLKALALGTHNLTAQYSATIGANFAVSTSTAQSVQVNDPLPALVSTTTTLGVSATTITVGQSVTLTANVTAANGATPTGSVTFFDNGAVLGNVGLVGGSASLLQALGLGTHNLTAQYSANAGANFAASTSAARSVQVNDLPPGVVLTTSVINVSATTITVGQTVTLTASVSAVNGTNPTGSVTFFDNGTALGTVGLLGGSASLLKALPLGSHILTVQYSANAGANFAASTSTARSVQVNNPPPPPAATQITGLTLATRKVGRTTTVTGIVLRVQGPLNAATANSLGNYSLATGRTVLKRVGGRTVRSTVYDRGVSLGSATYNAAAGTVTLAARGGRLSFAGTARLVAFDRILDGLNRKMDGDRNGTVGGNFAAFLTTRGFSGFTTASVVPAGPRGVK